MRHRNVSAEKKTLFGQSRFRLISESCQGRLGHATWNFKSRFTHIRTRTHVPLIHSLSRNDGRSAIKQPTHMCVWYFHAISASVIRFDGKQRMNGWMNDSTSQWRSECVSERASKRANNSRNIKLVKCLRYLIYLPCAAIANVRVGLCVCVCAFVILVQVVVFFWLTFACVCTYGSCCSSFFPLEQHRRNTKKSPPTTTSNLHSHTHSFARSYQKLVCTMNRMMVFPWKISVVVSFSFGFVAAAAALFLFICHICFCVQIFVRSANSILLKVPSSSTTASASTSTSSLPFK